MKNTILLISIALAAIAIVGSYTAGRSTPPIPQDVFHIDVINDAACRTCHTPGKQAPLKDSHPPKEECLACHKAK